MTRSTVKTLFAMLTTSAIAGVVLSILAPYGTHNLALFNRLIFWIGLCVAGGLGAGLAEFLIKRSKPKASIWWIAVAQSIGATLCVAVIFMTLSRPGSVANLFIVMFYIWVISIVISGIGALARHRQNVGNSLSRPAIHERMKPRFRTAELFALSSEDHYVRAYTSEGEDLILMRLSDAIKETTPLRGLQTHRSWWVAETGIDAVTKSDGKLIIQLKSGQTAPVSRNSAKSVRNAGWV